MKIHVPVIPDIYTTKDKFSSFSVKKWMSDCLCLSKYRKSHNATVQFFLFIYFYFSITLKLCYTSGFFFYLQWSDSHYLIAKYSKGLECLIRVRHVRDFFLLNVLRYVLVYGDTVDLYSIVIYYNSNIYSVSLIDCRHWLPDTNDVYEIYLSFL